MPRHMCACVYVWVCVCVCVIVCVHVQTERVYGQQDLIILKQVPWLMSDLPYGVIDEGRSDEHLMR